MAVIHWIWEVYEHDWGRGPVGELVRQARQQVKAVVSCPLVFLESRAGRKNVSLVFEQSYRLRQTPWVSTGLLVFQRIVLSKPLDCIPVPSQWI